MCKYQKSKPQPESIPYPRVQFESECGFILVLMEGYDQDWRNHKTHGKPISPKGRCMKCNTEIEMVDFL